jgi:hypothetical protein
MCVRKSDTASEKNAVLYCPADAFLFVSGLKVRMEDGSELQGHVCLRSSVDVSNLRYKFWENGINTLKKCNSMRKVCNLSETSFYKQADFYFERCAFNDWKICLIYECLTGMFLKY